MTIRERLEKLIDYRKKRKVVGDVWVSIFDNGCEYSPQDFGFFLNDYEDVKERKTLDYPLDNETRTSDKWAFSFDGLKIEE